MQEGLLEGTLVCRERNCPMIMVRGNYVCLLEHIDAHIGSKQVTEVVEGPLPGSPKAMLKFNDGHTLPMLCPDCGEPLHVVGKAAEACRRDLLGRYLVGLYYLKPEGELPASVEFSFARSPDMDPNVVPDKELEHVRLHMNGAKQIGCPDRAPRPAKAARKRRR